LNICIQYFYSAHVSYVLSARVGSGMLRSFMCDEACPLNDVRLKSEHPAHISACSAEYIKEIKSLKTPQLIILHHQLAEYNVISST
jgi:hypothetical protein